MADEEVHLVTGANGRTGFALCAHLKSRGFFVRALIRKTAERFIPFLSRYVDEFVYGDLRDPPSLEAAFAGAHYVYHLAGIVSIASKNTAEIVDVNVRGVQNVLEASFKAKIKRLVYTGTVHTLPFNDTESVLREIERFDSEKVHGPYAKSKALGSNLVLDAVKNGLNAVIAMPSGIVGGFELKLSNFGMMVSMASRGKLAAYLKGRYDFVDVRDVAAALSDLAFKGESGESYILSGHIVEVKDLVRYASEAAGRKPPAFCAPLPLVKAFSYPAEWWGLLRGATLVFTPYAIKVLQDNCNFSHTKISALTGYTPRSIEEAVAEQVKFHQEVYLPNKLWQRR